MEGPGFLFPELGDWWRDGERRERLPALIAGVAAEPSLLGLGGHLMAVGRRPRE